MQELQSSFKPQIHSLSEEARWKIWSPDNTEGFELCALSDQKDNSLTACGSYSAPANLYCRCCTMFTQEHADPETLDQIRKLALGTIRSTDNSRVLMRRTICDEEIFYGSTVEQEAYYRAQKSCWKALKKGYLSILNRFLQDGTHRELQLGIGWTEDTFVKLDVFARENHTYIAMRDERIR